MSVDNEMLGSKDVMTRAGLLVPIPLLLVVNKFRINRS